MAEGLISWSAAVVFHHTCNIQTERSHILLTVRH